MQSTPLTTWAGNHRCRAAVCVLLIPMLVLSSVCFDVFLTHAHDGEPEHTHASRTWTIPDADGHDNHHDREHPNLPYEPVSESPSLPERCETESTHVIVEANQAIRQSHAPAKQLIDISIAALTVGFIAREPDSAGRDLPLFADGAPLSPVPVFLRVCAMLI